jgi:hypothetical protein
MTFSELFAEVKAAEPRFTLEVAAYVFDGTDDGVTWELRTWRNQRAKYYQGNNAEAVALQWRADVKSELPIQTQIAGVDV